MNLVKIFFLLFISLPVYSQFLKNDGAEGNVTTGTIVSGGSIENANGTIINSGTITLTADLNNGATINGNGTYNVAGNWNNDGTFDAGTGTVVFNGGGAQTIGGLTLTDYFKNITIQNSSGGVSILANQSITGTLTLSSGTFTTTGKVFTLISNVGGTARIAEITGGSIAGNITMQRYISGNDGWRMLSSPVNTDIEDWNGEFAMSGFSGTDQPSYSFVSVLSYNEITPGDKNAGYETPASTAEVLSAGKGYLAWIGDAPGDGITKTLNLTGTPNTAGQTLPVTYNDDLGQPPSEDGWNLVGNPYPSTIDWDAAGWTKTNINGFFYIWNDDHQHYEGWMTGFGALSDAGSQNIPSMQGFWVQTNSNSPAPVLSADESVKSATDQAFFKKIRPGKLFLT